MPYPKDFFALQLLFARKMATLTQQTAHDAVRLSTALYRIMGLDWSLDPQRPTWQAYVQGLSQDGTEEEWTNWTYGFYLARYDQLPKYSTPRWGCFSYEYYAEQKIIRLHFANLDASGYGPLSSLRKEARIAELTSLFTHIKEKHPDAQSVHGGSWLYNRVEYIRLFPAEYRPSSRPSTLLLVGRGTWGQFLRHDETINQRTASLFREQVEQLRDSEKCMECFPYPTLLREGPIQAFYDFYHV